MPQTNLPLARRLGHRLGVCVTPSRNPKKKLDVFRLGKRVASVGARDYEDFLTHGDRERRRRYKQRHEKTRHRRGSPSFFADALLWPTDPAVAAARRLPLRSLRPTLKCSDTY